MERKQLNEIYKSLDTKAKRIIRSFGNGIDYTMAYYNGHYSKNEKGEYEIEYFPIPVISLKGCCDIEIELEGVTVSARLKREKALAMDYTRLFAYRFEVYGVEDYLSDYYEQGASAEELIRNLKESKEEEIGYSFIFDYDTDERCLYELICLLRENGFYNI